MLTVSPKVIVPLCVMCFFASFCLVVGLWGLWWSGRRQKAPPSSGPVCSEWSVSLWSSDPSSHQLLWWSPTFGHHQLVGHHQLFLETGPGGRSWGPGRTWHQLPHRCTSGKRLWSRWGWTSAGWWKRLVSDEPRFGMTEESCTFASSKPKAKSVSIFLCVNCFCPHFYRAVSGFKLICQLIPWHLSLEGKIHRVFILELCLKPVEMVLVSYMKSNFLRKHIKKYKVTEHLSASAAQHSSPLYSFRNRRWVKCEKP